MKKLALIVALAFFWIGVGKCQAIQNITDTSIRISLIKKTPNEAVYVETHDIAPGLNKIISFEEVENDKKKRYKARVEKISVQKTNAEGELVGFLYDFESPKPQNYQVTTGPNNQLVLEPA